MTATETTERRTFLIDWDALHKLLPDEMQRLIAAEDFAIIEASVDQAHGVVLTALRLQDDEVPAKAPDEEKEDGEG